MDKQYYKSNLVSENYLHNTIDFVLNEIYNLMKVCYGPYGSHVLIANNLGVEAMKDGQKILASYIPDQSIAASVHQSLKSVSNKQVEEIGDGSTTTILLLCELYKTFRKIIKDNTLSPSGFNQSLKEVIDDILSKINKHTVSTINEDESINWDILRDAVYTSVDANNELCDIIIKMYKELNIKDPYILVDTNSSSEHRYELVKGVELDGAPIASNVFFNGYSRKNMSNPLVIVVNGRMDLTVEYVMELDNTAMKNDRDYIIICTGIDDATLGTLVNLKNTNPALMNRVTFFQTRLTASNDEFLDICASLGAKPIDSETLTKYSTIPAMLSAFDKNAGTCEKALMTEFCVRFNNPKSDDEMVSQRIEIIDGKINDLKEDPTSHNDKVSHLENRKAFLMKNYAKLFVGGTSPQRKSINYELAKDGVLQASSCLKHGVVEGCNTLIPKIVEAMDEYDDQVKNDIALAISNAYTVLFIQLIYNKCGSWQDACSDYDTHYNENGCTSFNLRDDDITPVINSAATDITILKNATDMASLLATSKAFLSNRPEFDSLNNQ